MDKSTVASGALDVVSNKIHSFNSINYIISAFGKREEPGAIIFYLFTVCAQGNRDRAWPQGGDRIAGLTFRLSNVILIYI